MTDSPNPGAPDADAVQAFYNDFADSRMLGYLEQSNPRIEKAIATVLPLVERDARVLDVGCGIGLATERIASAAPDGFVWACDISDRNIEIATQRSRARNVAFRVGDVMRGFAELQAWVGGPVQLVTLIDVVEHIPLEAHAELLHNLRGLMTSDATLCLTFPSPGYQRFLRRHRPGELQIVDELVEPWELGQRAREAGFHLKRLTLEDVWYTNQYVHCVLQTSPGLHRVEQDGRYWQAVRELAAAVPPEATLILVDEARWDGDPLPGRRLLPFLERDGQYWGAPPDGAVAVAELARLQHAGAGFIAFPEATFWWLDAYPELRDHLRSAHECVHESGHVVVFRLREAWGDDRG